MFFQIAKTNAERQKVWRERQRQRGVYKANERIRNTHRRQQISETQLITHNHNGKLAIRKWRQALAENKTEKLLVNIITPYRNKSSLGRAACRVQSVMQDSPRKQRAIFTHLAPKVLGFSVQPQEKTKPTEKEVETLVKKYYVDDVISRVMPGKADTMAIWVDGKNKIHQKRHLTMTIRETYALFCNDNPEQLIGRSKFASLRPTFVLLSSQLPHNSCGCTYHTNVIELLEPLHHKLPDIFLFIPKIVLLQHVSVM